MTFPILDSLTKLQQDNLDFVILSEEYLNRLEDKLFAKYEIYYEEFILVGNKEFLDSRPDNSEEIKSWLLTLPWIEHDYSKYHTKTFLSTVLDNNGEDYNFSPSIIVNDIPSIISALQKGFGVSVIPKHSCEVLITKGELYHIEIPDKERVLNNIYLTCKKDKLKHKSHVDFITLLTGEKI